MRYRKLFKSEKLIKTHKYIDSAMEDIDTFRIRKIKWAIEEMNQNGIGISGYKVYQYAGFGEIKNEGVRKMVEGDGWSGTTLPIK